MVQSQLQQRSNKIKILYLVTQSDFGGAQKYVYDLATNISENFSILVAGGECAFTGTNQQAEQSELAKKLAEKNIRYIYLSRLKRAIKPWYDILALWQIIKLIRQEKPDIIHLNSSKISILGSLASLCVMRYRARHADAVRRAGALCVIYTVHGWVFNENLPAWQKLFYKILERFTARWKDRVICLSEMDKQIAVKQKIAPAKKIAVIYNGIAPINFLSRAEAREKLGLPPDALVVGSIGNLYKNKGYDYLIDAVNKLQILDFRLQIVIIGQGPELNNLKSKIKNLKLEDTIKLFGTLPNAAHYLNAFDLYVCSSLKEGLPYSLLEAMQAGLPIVSTNVGAIPEILQDKKNGLLLEPKNPLILAQNIQHLIDNPDLAKKLGEQAKKDVMKRFTIEKMIEQTKKVYCFFHC